MTSKITFLFLLFFASFFVSAQQEEISTLIRNSDVISRNKLQQRAFPDIFIYLNDTLTLPVKDDFSTNKFRKFNAEPGGPGVTQSQFKKLWDDPPVNPYPANTRFSTIQTYEILYDTLPDGTPTTTINNLNSINITVYDLTTYPFTSSQLTVWPDYNIIDTLYLPDPPETLYVTNNFIEQDSVNIYTVSPIADGSIWEDNYAYLNNRYAVNPPTVGVATLDGLNEKGYPYDFVNITAHGIADALTSKPINLSGFSASDSVYLSFMYQPMGLGNTPEAEDSLVLEFWSPAFQTWKHIWSTKGKNLHEFKNQIVPITQTQFLQNGFQFRFKNYATLSGALDHWHIDYVYLNSFRTIADTIRDDVAFRIDALTLLKDYISMPWRHFKWSPAAYMRDTLTLFQRNNNNSARLVANNYGEVFFNNNIQAQFQNVNTPSINGFTNFTTQYQLLDILNSNIPFVYDDNVNDTLAEFDVRFHFQVTPDFTRENDTIRFKQIFRNFYAYDDGTAEAAYGPQGAGALLAYKFYIAQPDTLRSVRIHFEPSVNNVSNKPFRLTIWDANGPGGTPGNIIYQNTTFSTPVYEDGYNSFHEYHLDNKILLNGNFYVGWQQVDAIKLNIGFDLNTNSQNKIYYNVGSSWQQTSFQASLMMRPVFTYHYDYSSVEEYNNLNHLSAKAYPNPANNYLTIEIEDDLNGNMLTVHLSDVSGRLIKSITTSAQKFTIPTQDLNPGIYLVELLQAQTKYAVQKIIIQR